MRAGDEFSARGVVGAWEQVLAAFVGGLRRGEW